jgi:hypothetical protein
MKKPAATQADYRTWKAHATALLVWLVAVIWARAVALRLWVAIAIKG